ncbi:hypothetical protein Pve01_82670 [Planomonospora venezuelensis]|nr:hypothetical protein Pve01_82670 [Planomonospora venezuelensis]
MEQPREPPCRQHRSPTRHGSDPPVRVLVASKFLHHVGGVETYIAWLARHLPTDEVELGFLGMTPPEGEDLMPDLDGPAFLTPNRDYHGSLSTKLRSAATSIYSRAAAAVMDDALDRFAPDVVHFQSTCYQLTPSVVSAVARRDVPMVTTAHEYKFVCSNQRLWNDGNGQPCTKCLGAGTTQRLSNVVSTKCVKGSLASSVVAAAELPVSNAVWRRAPGIVHAPSRYMAVLLEDVASPVRGRVRYLDLAWGDPVPPDRPTASRLDVTYLGRLSTEKGVDTLVRAWPAVMKREPAARLRLFGVGSDEDRLRELAGDTPNIEFCGRYERADLAVILATSAMTVHPSTWAENSPYTVRESLQHSVPAIVSDQGGLPEMVGPETGTVVPAADHGALANAILQELKFRRAGGNELEAAVRARAVSDNEHSAGLREMYADASEMVRRES